MAEKAPRNTYFPHKRVQSIPSGKSRTKQSFQKETDINFILAQTEKGLLVTHVNQHEGNYGDFIDAQDYHTSLNLIHDAQASFLSIPASIRAKFDNDPAKFLEFAQNPDNSAELIEMGLANEPPLYAEGTAPPPPPDPAPEAPTAPEAPS